LADTPPELEWLANITNPKTRLFYKSDVGEFMAFTGLRDSSLLRSVARLHVIAWRKNMEAGALGSWTTRRKLSAVSSLFDYFCERNVILGNPVDGVKRPTKNNNEGSTPALGDIQTRQGVPHFRIQGKRGKIRFVPVHPMALRLIGEYLEAGKHSHESLDEALFRPVANNRTGTLNRDLDHGSLYQNIVMKYAKATGISGEAIGACVHSMRATAATNALSNEADIAKVQEWLGHANVSTTRL
jgi:site-specific recombinase XerD